MTIESIVRGINRELMPVFEERLRAALADHDREWLVDQIVRLTLDAHSLQEIDRRTEREAKARPPRAPRAGRGAGARPRRARRVHRGARRRDPGVARSRTVTCGRAPEKGTALLAAEHRSDAGEALLTPPRTCCSPCCSATSPWAATSTASSRSCSPSPLPRFKAGALDFMRASTELAAAGTWQDPESVSNDERADNVLLEVQYGDIEDERVGDGIIVALTLINNLEVNEQVLYARMINVEQTTLII